MALGRGVTNSYERAIGSIYTAGVGETSQMSSHRCGYGYIY